MALLIVRTVPPRLLRSLRAAARRDRRSLPEEVIQLLEEALRDRGERCGGSPHDVKAQLATWRDLAGTWQSDVDPETEADQLMAARSSR